MLNRRRLLTSSAVVAATLAVARRTYAADLNLYVVADQPGAEISPHLYGHFIEHLGGVIYDGVWVGSNSTIPNIGGIRKSFVDDMKRLAAPNIRWPGGCFADSYHWRDGVGPAAQRPRTATYWGDQMPPELQGAEPNTFGTHEFMRLCRLVGASPYLAANVASGSPQEFHDWVTYCNAPRGTTSLAAERATAGDPEPFDVRFWGIGNESWNCGGLMKPAEYAHLYRLFTSQIPPYQNPFLIACGPRGHSADFNTGWTEGFFEAMQDAAVKPRIHGLSIHFYTDFRQTQVSAAESTAAEWRAVMEKGARLEQALLKNWSVMKRYDPDHRIRFVLDEWGVWYAKSPEIAPGFQLAQMITLRDAVHTGMHFDIFNRHADKIAMANVAQTINCLHSLFLAHEDKFVRTPVFHVFDLYKPHMGARYVAIQGTGDMFSSSASILGKDLTVSMTNASTDAAIRVRLRLPQTVRPTEATAQVLTHTAMNAANTFGQPDEVRPRPLEVVISGGEVTANLPARSVSTVRVRVT